MLRLDAKRHTHISADLSMRVELNWRGFKMLESPSAPEELLGMDKVDVRHTNAPRA
jgi:hypothetical protein